MNSDTWNILVLPYAIFLTNFSSSFWDVSKKTAAPLIIAKPKPAKPPTKLKMDESEMDDGWDDS
jgi:hypothetical protein